MKKSNFINAINFDEQILSNLYDKLQLCINSDINLYSDYFYPPNVWKIIEDMNLDCIIESEGVFEDSERRAIRFSSFNEYGNALKQEIVLMKITNKSRFRELSHKDYLGSVMSLGIKREKFGDFIVDGENCYFPTFADIADLMERELTSVGRNPVDIQILEREKVNIYYKFKSMNILVPSFRIDAVIAKLCSVSRGKAVEIINKGEVLYNYLEVKDKDLSVSFPATISIRKQGKFILENENGVSKKDKRYISVKKFI